MRFSAPSGYRKEGESQKDDSLEGEILQAHVVLSIFFQCEHCLDRGVFVSFALQVSCIPAIFFQSNGSSMSYSSSVSGSSDRSLFVLEMVTCPLMRGAPAAKLASRCALALPSTPMWEGTCNHCIAVPGASVSYRNCV